MEIKKNINCDVLVVGAGAAGCAAAITAAENGCSTLLIDQAATLGGTYSAAKLNTVCGIYLNNPDNKNPQILSSRFIECWLSKVNEHDKSFMPCREGRLYTAPCRSELMIIILSELIAEQSARLTYLPHTTLNSVIHAANKITEVSATLARGQSLTIIPKTVIDCSGSGAAITERQKPLEATTAHDVDILAALPFILTNCQYSELLSLKTAYELSKLVKQHRCPHYWRFLVLRQGDNHNINGWFNFPLPAFNSAIEAKSEIYSMVEFLGEHLSEFKSAQVSWCGDEICRRDAPVIDGVNCLTATDIMMGKKQSDAMLCGSWPIELWAVRKGQQLIYPPINDCYNIPDGCLSSVTYANLFAAGKGISATHEAQAAIRVTGLAFATGERAAMLACKVIKNI